MNVSDAELQAIGAALLNVVVTVQHLGHASPACTLDYMGGLDVSGNGPDAPLILRDFIAWTSGREEVSPDCADRLKGYTQQSGYYRHCIDHAFDRIATVVDGEIVIPA